MGVWAHPDDEIFAMAGVYALAHAAGQKTVCITATRGEEGVQDELRWPRANLAEIRTKEMSKAAEIIGIEHHHWLDYADGSCRDINIDEAALRIAEFIDKYQPDTIMTFGPDGMTGHDDHKTVSLWTDHAVELAVKKPTIYHVVVTEETYAELKQADEEFDMFFNTDRPCICSSVDCSLLFELDDETLDKKMKALEAMPSQTERLLASHRRSIRRSSRIESFMRTDCC